MPGHWGVRWEFFGHSHAWRAVILACGMAWFGPAADLAAGTLISPGAAELIRKSAEPFGLFATTLVRGRLAGKMARRSSASSTTKGCSWRFATATASAACPRPRCNSSPSSTMRRAREGRARLGEINRAINLAIRPMSDLAQYGEIDVWSSPLVTFATGAGDCEDYAIAKFVALRQAGISPDDLRIVIMRDTIRGEDHAVAAARLDGHWLTLDNRRMAMVEDAYIRNYRPLFVIDQHGVMQYVDAPPLAGVPDRDARAVGRVEFDGTARFDRFRQLNTRRRGDRGRPKRLTCPRAPR